MAEREKLTTQQLKGILAASRADALGSDTASKLSKERSDAMDMYLGEMNEILPAQADRSAAVSTDVADTIEGIMPSLMEIFATGDEIVRFDPVGPEDEEAAQQETDYINHVFMQKNNGYEILYSFFKDALLQKNGIVKAWWETKEEEDRKTVYDLTDDAYQLILAEIEENEDENVEFEIAEHSEREEDAPGAVGEETGAEIPGEKIKLHDLTLVTRRKYGCPKVEGVPPEDFGIERSAKSVHIKDASYCYHDTTTTEAELIAQDYDEAQVRKLPTGDSDDTEESQARDTVEDGDATSEGTYSGDRPIRITEHYKRLDYDGDGKLRLYKITTHRNGDILIKDGKPDIEVMDLMPFAGCTPIIMPHRHFGRALADIVADIQKIKTVVLRQLLDNAYLANNARMELPETAIGDATIDDLLTNRPGGIVRTKVPDQMRPIVTAPIGDFAYPLLEAMDMTREWRTGVTRQGQGIDANALQNQSATAVATVFTAAQARMRLIARNIAETGLKDLFWLLHALVRKNDTQTNTVNLRGKWVEVDPRQWRARTDLTVSVGNGTKDQQMAFLMAILGLQKEAMAAGSKLADEGTIYNTVSRLIQLGGLKNPETYFNDPAKIEEEEGGGQEKPDPAMVELEGKMELERMQAEADIAVQDRKAQSEIALAEKKFQFEQRLKLLEMQAKNPELQLTLRDVQLPDGNVESVVVSAEDIRLQRVESAVGQLTELVQNLTAFHAAPVEIIRDPVTKRAVGARKMVS